MSVAAPMPATIAEPRRDPATRGRLTAIVVGLAILWPLLALSEFHPSALFGTENMQVMANYLAGFLPPSTAPDFLALLGQATLQTLAIATAGISLAFVVAAPLAVLATRPLAASRIGPGPGRFVDNAMRTTVRGLLVVLRSVPEVVWALVFVRALGLGPGAGVLALAVTYGGMLGKVYIEILESGDTRSARALLEVGAGRLAALFYGLVPGAAQELASYTVYRWECAVRASVVMGFVGAGGLGQLMDQSMKMLAGGETSSILITFLGLVILADLISVVIRKVLA